MVNTLYFLMSPSTHPNFTLWGVLRWKWEHIRSPRREAVWEKKVLDLKNIFYASRTLPAKLSVLLPFFHIPDYGPLEKQYFESWTRNIYAHLVFTHTQKSGTVWAEVDVVDLFLMCCKVMNLKSVINFNPWMLISVSVIYSFFNLILSSRCDLTLARSGKLQTLRWPSSPPVANSFPCGEILTTYRIGNHQRRALILMTFSRKRQHSTHLSMWLSWMKVCLYSFQWFCLENQPAK